VLMRDSVIYLITFLGQVFIYLAALNGWRVRQTRKPHPIFYLPFYFTMVNLAAVVATLKFISGERQRVWDKAESARLAPVGTSGQRVVPSVRPLVARDTSTGRSRDVEPAEVAGRVAKN